MKNLKKGFYLTIAVLFFSLCIFYTPVKASNIIDNKDISSSYNEETFKSSEQRICDNEFLQLIQEEFGYSFSENETLFTTTDAPEDVKGQIKNRASDYTVNTYSYTKVFQTTNFWGFKEDFISITVSGAVYVYNDGKVHLFSMSLSATVYESGWSISFDSPRIINTDGTFSIGFGQVYCSKLTTLYQFGCSVSIDRWHPYADVDISQIG